MVLVAAQLEEVLHSLDATARKANTFFSVERVAAWAKAVAARIRQRSPLACKVSKASSCMRALLVHILFIRFAQSAFSKEMLALRLVRSEKAASLSFAATLPVAGRPKLVALVDSRISHLKARKAPAAIAERNY